MLHSYSTILKRLGAEDSEENRKLLSKTITKTYTWGVNYQRREDKQDRRYYQLLYNNRVGEPTEAEILTREVLYNELEKIMVYGTKKQYKDYIKQHPNSHPVNNTYYLSYLRCRHLAEIYNHSSYQWRHRVKLIKLAADFLCKYLYSNKSRNNYTFIYDENYKKEEGKVDGL